MSFPNVSDILATTIENRSGKCADNVRKNNALLMRLQTKGNIQPFDGGHKIYQELAFAENTNGAWYSGADPLAVDAQDVLSAAEFAIKQYAVPVILTGLEKLQNSGEGKIISLIANRVKVAESTMANALAQGVYSDGTAAGGKQIGGLDLLVPASPSTGTAGGIPRASWTFWQSQLHDPASTPTATTIQPEMNTLWAKCVRGNTKPDLVPMGGTVWATYMASLQAIQRFNNPATAELGFESVKYMSADVVLDGGIGGFGTATNLFMLNTDYLFLRPHSDRNFVPLDPSSRSPVNQDVTVQILGWAGNMTASGLQFQGRGKFD